MINKGRYSQFYLYEVTEQDLLVPTETAARYTAGNVLVFADKKEVDLGRELARADDIATAHEYLANSEALLFGRIQELQSQNRELLTRIDQRDELLRDLSEDLRYERDMASIFQTKLNEAQSQLEVGSLSLTELIDDLQQVSVDTRTVEVELEKTLAEKANLEQELAERIADLVALNLQNDELKRQLSGGGEAPDSPKKDSQVLTVSSGKQVHVYHEFPSPPKRTARATVSLVARSFLRTSLLLAIVAVLFIVLSVATTAALNNISIGEALDYLVSL